MRSMIGQGTTNRRNPDGDRTVFLATFGLLTLLCVGILLSHVFMSALSLVQLWRNQP